MRVAVNALPVAEGKTGMGAYAAALVASTARFGDPHSYLYLTRPGADIQPLLAEPDRPSEAPPHTQQLAVESSGMLFEQLQLPTELSSRGWDIYHSPLFTCPIVDELPSVITVHDVIPETRPDLCTSGFLEFWRSRIGPCLRAARWVVTTSQFSRREITRH